MVLSVERPMFWANVFWVERLVFGPCFVSKSILDAFDIHVSSWQ